MWITIRQLRGQIQSIVSQFIIFQQFQRPLRRAFENAATLAQALPRIEQDAAALRAALSERGAPIDEAYSRAGSADEQRSASVAESEALRARISMIEKERDDLADALVAARAEMARDKSALAEREVALAEASRRADDLAETLHSTQVVLATHDAAVDAMQGVIASLRGTFERTEQEARERAAAADAMQPAIGTLRCEHDVPRDVGRAALAALRAMPQCSRGTGECRMASSRAKAFRLSHGNRFLSAR